MKVLLASAFLLAGANAAVPGMTKPKCRTMCQRFGMKALGAEFKDIRHPTECMSKCDEVYGEKTSFLQKAKKPAPEGTKQVSITPVVKK